MSRIGNISNAAGVGYTEMTGLGLTTETQTQVRSQADASEGMATDILNALAQFRAEGNFNPTTREMEAKLSTLSAHASDPNALTAHQWLTQELGGEALRDSYSVGQWGEIAQKLQINAAKKRSELSLGHGGGIQQFNGQYFVNGQEMSLSQVNFCVRANQYQLVDQQIADQLDAIQRNNAKAKQAQDVLAAFKQYDGENIGVNQSASIDVSWMIEPGTDASGVIEHYLNSKYGTTATSNPSYRDFSNMIATGSYSTDVRTITDIQTQLPNVNLSAGAGGVVGATNAVKVLNSLAGYLGLTTPATYTQVKNKLAVLAPTFTPPTDATGWTPAHVTALNTAFENQKYDLNRTLDSAKTATMKSQLDGFFGTLKAADPNFYSSHIADTNGGPPYKMTGTMTNAAFGDLKAAFGTWLQSNSTDNQVAQQRLESLNNTRQAVLDGMSAFTQGQSQVTDRIGGNL